MRRAIGTAVAVLIVIGGLTAAAIFLLRNFGLESLYILAIASICTACGYFVRWLHKDGRITVSHIIAVWIVGTGTIFLLSNYYLAYRGIAANLETLGRYIAVEMVAGVFGYYGKSLGEKVSANKAGINVKD
jgi:predicted nucleic acid-binding Zn finger protein